MKIALCLPWYSEPPRYIRDAVDAIEEKFGIEDRIELSKAGIADARCQIASVFLASSCDLSLWIDADIVPTIQATMEIIAAARDHDVVSGNYWKADESGASWSPISSGLYTNGVGGGLVPALVGFGFCVARRSAFKCAAEHSPKVGKERMYFAQFQGKSGRWLPEDYAFSERVRAGGGDVVVDTSVLVGHLPRRPKPVFPPEWAVEMTAPEPKADE